jgi:hypothetical protein
MIVQIFSLILIASTGIPTSLVDFEITPLCPKPFELFTVKARVVMSNGSVIPEEHSGHIVAYVDDKKIGYREDVFNGTFFLQYGLPQGEYDFHIEFFPLSSAYTPSRSQTEHLTVSPYCPFLLIAPQLALLLVIGTAIPCAIYLVKKRRLRRQPTKFPEAKRDKSDG